MKCYRCLEDLRQQAVEQVGKKDLAAIYMFMKPRIDAVPDAITKTAMHSGTFCLKHFIESQVSLSW